MRHYDLAIIGSGSGNPVVTAELSRLRIALIEESVFGGTCLNVGCIPTKMFVYTADIAHTVRDSSRFGIDAKLDDVRWRDIRDRIFGRIDPLSAGGRRYRESSDHITLYSAHAEFVDASTLRLSTGETITADRIVVAAGARATVPPVVADSGVDFHTSDTIMRLDELPRRLVILGGGYIAAEFAHVFGSLGTEVSIVTRGDGMLRRLDRDISLRFTEAAGKRWNLVLNRSVAALEQAGAELTMQLDDGSELTADTLLVATGRRANGDRLNAAAAGIALHEDGRIVVDKYQRSTAAGIWALGDVSSPQQLKHVANADARVVAHNLAHPDALIASRHQIVPAAVFSNPQVATVGLTEEEALDAGYRIQVLRQHYSDTAYGWAMEDSVGYCKVVVESGSGRLLGAHILGAEAAVLIQPVVQAMEFGQSALEVARGQYWIHPALTEVVENALLQFDPKRRT
ncbi:mycothione reductase [Jatrophihabitans sp. GAS493]|uniref:mycothione reductase n=1 Tax=Jatrophihabitans sp. GAS493 TaxID=1907575 RepID=UPI000BB99D23|nr:mycothione reductase [Jatrophihabitans sp. GAS493]SOD74029.1 mycothione reductase [Jatrophihabitans sp. GAS493]